MEKIKRINKKFKNPNIRSIFTDTAIIVGILLANTIVFSLTGFGIPCVFRLFTGLQCPGCGMTHAAIELAKGNIHGAVHYNVLSVTMMPIIVAYLIYKGINIIRTGSTKMKLWENIFLVFCCIVMVVFCVYRNIPSILSLAY
ncbi:DUF2752 domain-containing protein [Butyrivibrio sp. LC3010]|uniref:DUF2752 domain-containing protein n=1 Tax=Butyrivibrio sp. LC3010 TaxID=1280680 RepID=UPI0004185102|nr:DUF2752 domain-containing protein [Butyrivibrio sp. LC3010]